MTDTLQKEIDRRKANLIKTFDMYYSELREGGPGRLKWEHIENLIGNTAVWIVCDLTRARGQDEVAAILERAEQLKQWRTEWETIQSMENPNVQREAEKIIATGRQLLDDMPGAPTAK